MIISSFTPSLFHQREKYIQTNKQQLHEISGLLMSEQIVGTNILCVNDRCIKNIKKPHKPS